MEKLSLDSGPPRGKTTISPDILAIPPEPRCCSSHALMTIFQNLFVWRESADLAVLVIDLSRKLALDRHYALADQIIRSALSVPSNIAKGQGRSTTRDRRHFFIQARGSLYEMETQLVILERAGLWKDEGNVHIRMQRVSAGLTKIINRLA